MKKEIADILIIGAGPSGMVAASYLNAKGVAVQVVEKQKFPRFSIGESLIPRCMDNFEEAGLLEVIKKQGFQKKYGARFIKNGAIAEFDFSQKFSEGWDWTWQVPRAEFDKVLTDEVESRGVPIYFENEVICVNKLEEHWEIETLNKNGIKQKFKTKFIIDSSGAGRVIAKQLNLEAPAKISGHSSIFTHIKEEERPTGKEGELISFEILETQAWFWYIPFSNGNSSLGFVAPTNWFQNLQGNNTEVFKQLLIRLSYFKQRFSNKEFLFEPVKVENISKNVTKIYGEGFALTGNSAEFLDPIFSSGVAFATESGLQAAKLAYRELNNEKVNWEKEYAQYMKKAVFVFSTYVKEWYSGRLQDIIFHPSPNSLIKKQICAVLAGYVWDSKNPFVRNHERVLERLSGLIS